MQFDPSGLPQPPADLVKITHEQLARLFGEIEDQGLRADTLRRYNNNLALLKHRLPSSFTQFIGGSFTTLSSTPSDLDTVTIAERKNIGKELLEALADDLDNEKLNARLDNYFVLLFPPGHEHFTKSIKRLLDWFEFLAKDGNNNPRAVISVDFERGGQQCPDLYVF